MRSIVHTLILTSFLAMTALSTSVFGQQPVTGIVNADRQFVIRGQDVELAGLDFNSAQGLLLPVPNDVKEPAAPFSFLLSNTRQKITYGSLGRGVILDGEIVLLAGYTGNSPEKDLTAFWGRGPTPVPLPVTIASGPPTTTFLSPEGRWADEKNWSAGIPNAKVPALIPNGIVRVGSDPQIPAPVAGGLTIGESVREDHQNAELLITGKNLRVLGPLKVGTSRAGSIEAVLATEQEKLAGGEVFVAHTATFGQVQTGQGVAFGKSSLDGSLLVEPNSGNVDLIVGRNNGGGQATGDLIVRGAAGQKGAEFRNVRVGWSEHSDGGSAIGRMVAGQMRSHADGTELAVGLNSGLGHASGYLEVAEGIRGFSRALVGVSTGGGTADGTLVVGKLLEAGSIQIGEVLRDPTAQIRSQGKLIANDAIIQGSSLQVGQGSELLANMLNVKSVVNAGLMAPNRTPNSVGGSQVLINGSFSQTTTGVTRLKVFGPDTREYDSVRVTGSATLGGRVELDFAKEFEPKLGQVFEVFHAEAMKTDGLYLNTRGLPDDLALNFDQNPRNAIKLDFVKPESIPFLNPLQASDRWSNPELWGGGVTPTSVHQINLENRNPRPQSLVVDENVTVQSIRLAGDSSTMSLAIQEDTGFSATHKVLIGRRGRVELDNGLLAASDLEISIGGAIAGQGQLIGDVTNRGLMQFSSSATGGGLRVDGNYSQSSSGILQVDLADVSSVEFGALTIMGTADVDGLLQLNIPDDLELGPGLRIPVLIATEGIEGNFQLDLPFENYPDLEFGIQSDGDEYYFISSNMTTGNLGDLDRNGSVDLCDIDAFAVGMSDFQAYSTLYGGEDGITWTPVSRGDINGDGDFDFDDIPPFFEMVDGVDCVETLAATVPEPLGMLPLGCFVVLWQRRKRV